MIVPINIFVELFYIVFDRNMTCKQNKLLQIISRKFFAISFIHSIIKSISIEVDSLSIHISNICSDEITNQISINNSRYSYVICDSKLLESNPQMIHRINSMNSIYPITYRICQTCKYYDQTHPISHGIRKVSICRDKLDLISDNM